MMAVVAGITTIVLALLGAALKMTSKDVMESLGEWRRQEVVELKRTLARRMYRLAALLLLCCATFPFVADVILEFDPDAIPIRLNFWAFACLAAAWQVLGIMWTCIGLSSALRDPNVLSLRETLSMFFPSRSDR